MATTRFVNGVTLTEAEWFNFLDAIGYGYLTNVAGTNTITATGPKGLSAYGAGQRWILVPANDNTGATTVNITPDTFSALGARNIYSWGAACVGGELQAGVPYLLYDDGTQLNIVGARFLSGVLDISAGTQGQIKFPATQNPSADANTLDDYEENTWTPGISFDGGTTGITYGAQSGSYTKIGRMVYCFFSFRLTSKGSSTGDAAITGLPFTVNAAIQGTGVFSEIGLLTGVYTATARPTGGATTALMRYLNAASPTIYSNIDDTFIDGSGTFTGSLIYNV